MRVAFDEVPAVRFLRESDEMAVADFLTGEDILEVATLVKGAKTLLLTRLVVVAPKAPGVVARIGPFPFVDGDVT